MNKPLALVIEDDPDLSEIFAMTLRSSGFETEVFQDGQAALNRLSGTPPAVILLDLHLPRVTGATILQNIRANERFAKTSVIVATADARQAADLHVKADLILLKPVGVDQLRELAKRMLQLWNATDAPAK